MEFRFITLSALLRLGVLYLVDHIVLNNITTVVASSDASVSRNKATRGIGNAYGLRAVDYHLLDVNNSSFDEKDFEDAGINH